MQLIIQNLSLWDRVKLRTVCKSWSSVSMRKDARSYPSEKPWLLSLYESLNRSNKEKISLFRLADSKVHHLVMVKGLFSRVVLLDPISGAHQKLPSLSSVFPHLAALKELKEDVGSTLYQEFFCDKVVLSSPDIHSQGCIVAAIFGFRILALCRPGDKTWRIALRLEKSNRFFLDDLVFSCGKLYVLVHRKRWEDEEVFDLAAAEARDLAEQNVEVKLVYDLKPPHPTCWFNESYLIESVAKNEVFLVHKSLDWTPQKVSMTVYKVDDESGMFHEVKNLGNQIIFLSDFGSSSLDSAASKENCIYLSALHYPGEMYETGIFYPESGKIKTISCLEFVEVNRSVTDIPNGGWPCWFAPNLH